MRVPFIMDCSPFGERNSGTSVEIPVLMNTAAPLSVTNRLGEILYPIIKGYNFVSPQD